MIDIEEMEISAFWAPILAHNV